MTINDFLSLISKYNIYILIYFICLPILSFALGIFYKSGIRLSATDYLFSALIYLAAIPGMLSATLLFYAMFLARQNMLQVNVLLYFVPLISMGSVFLIIRRKTGFDHLPGFNRLSGLMIILGLVCIAVLFLYRLHFFIGFFGTLQELAIAGILLFALFKFGAKRLTGKK